MEQNDNAKHCRKRTESAEKPMKLYQSVHAKLCCGAAWRDSEPLAGKAHCP
jgi:hypothetical protein